MKNFALFIFSLLLIQNVHSQTDIKRRGLFVSMAVGAPFGSPKASDGVNSANVNGSSASVDLQIGGAIHDNLFLHGTFLLKTISTPEWAGVKFPSGTSFDETVIGGGLTKYFNHNFFLTGNMGVGKFGFRANSTSMESDGGFSFQIKVGKEFWVSHQVLMGLSTQYSHTSASNIGGMSNDIKWEAGRFGIMLNISYIKHGR